MNNKFDIDRAKAGEPVELNNGFSNWVPAHFVGPSSLTKEQVIVEAEGCVLYAHLCVLRMASKKIKVRYRVYLRMSPSLGRIVPDIARDDGRVMNVQECDDFIKWIHTDWQEVEVEQ